MAATSPVWTSATNLSAARPVEHADLERRHTIVLNDAMLGLGVVGKRPLALGGLAVDVLLVATDALVGHDDCLGH